MLHGSYIPHHIVNGVEPMVVPNPVSFVSLWLLVLLLWKPAYYVVMYVYGVVTKNATTPVTYGALLHTWITSLFSLVL